MLKKALLWDENCNQIEPRTGFKGFNRWRVLCIVWKAVPNARGWREKWVVVLLGSCRDCLKVRLVTQVILTAVRSKAVVLLLLTFCLLLLPLWESVIVLCFVVRYFMSILVLQSSWWGRESWLLCLICLPGVSWWLSGSSSRCHGVVCSLWLWYFLIISRLTRRTSRLEKVF